MKLVRRLYLLARPAATLGRRFLVIAAVTSSLDLCIHLLFVTGFAVRADSVFALFVLVEFAQRLLQATRPGASFRFNSCFNHSMLPGSRPEKI